MARDAGSNIITIMKYLNLELFLRILSIPASIIFISIAIVSAPSPSPAVSDIESDCARTSLPTVRPNLDIMRVAHRGVKVLAPENTLPAVRKAIEMGYDYVEVDLRYTRDGVPVIFHDLGLSRKTNGFGTVAKHKFAYIRKLDAGAWFDESYANTPIPTFEEYLRTMSGKINLYLDLKSMPRPDLIELMKKYGYGRHNTVVVGFLKKYQRKMAELMPDAPMMPWLGKAEEVDKVLEKFPTARAFNTSCKQLTPEMVSEAHRRGVMVFTNVLRIPRSKEKDCMRRTIEFGADAIQIDHPAVLDSVLEEMAR